MLCPRREEHGNTAVFNFPKDDEWGDDGTCSFCGSLSPDQFFAAVEAGAEVQPTTKSYKVYLGGDHAPKIHGMPKLYFQHLNEDEKKRFIDLYNGDMNLAGRFSVRPYFCQEIS